VLLVSRQHQVIGSFIVQGQHLSLQPDINTFMVVHKPIAILKPLHLKQTKVINLAHRFLAIEKTKTAPFLASFDQSRL